MKKYQSPLNEKQLKDILLFEDLGSSDTESNLKHQSTLYTHPISGKFWFC